MTLQTAVLIIKKINILFQYKDVIYWWHWFIPASSGTFLH